MAQLDASSHVSPARYTERRSAVRFGPRVLVADGDPMVRSALRLVLSRTYGSLGVSEASDAADLFRAVAANVPDLVLLDWNLPGLQLDGAFAALRMHAPGAAIVVMGTRPELRAEAMAAGADVFVCKADDPALLLATIRCLAQP